MEEQPEIFYLQPQSEQHVEIQHDSLEIFSPGKVRGFWENDEQLQLQVDVQELKDGSRFYYQFLMGTLDRLCS